MSCIDILTQASQAKSPTQTLALTSPFLCGSESKAEKATNYFELLLPAYLSNASEELQYFLREHLSKIISAAKADHETCVSLVSELNDLKLSNYELRGKLTEHQR
jgi:hypothetical protein